MTVGLLLCAAGLALLARVVPGAAYLPAVLVFAVGLTATAAPPASAVFAAVDRRHLGAASGANKTVAWVAGLVAVAVRAAGIDAAGGGPFGPGLQSATLISAVACAVGALVAFATVRRRATIVAQPVPAVTHPCQEPSVSGQPPGGSRAKATMRVMLLPRHCRRARLAHARPFPAERTR
jgi:hypothetical protein